MKSIFKIAPVVCILLLAGCSPSRVAFTQQLREKYKLKPEELKSIQFYTSGPFVLRRGENAEKKETSNGELTLVKNDKIEEIEIKTATPCIIKEIIDGNRVKVSFEEGDSRYLVFGSAGNKDGYYTLMASEWVGGKGAINYGEQLYYSSVGSRDIFLTLKMKSLDELRIEKKVMKGQKVK